MELNKITSDGITKYVLLDDNMHLVKPVNRYLEYLRLRGRAERTVRSYGYDLKAFFTFLQRRGLTYEIVDAAMIQEYVEYLRSSHEDMIEIYVKSSRASTTINRMTCHYLTLKEHEIKQMYSDLILQPDAIIAGKGAERIKAATKIAFAGRTEKDIDSVISSLAKTISFNPLPGGVCLYDYRRGNCANGDGCFFYNCPNFVTEVSFLPVLRKELDLMEKEMRRTEELGHERQWQIQNSRYQCLLPLVRELEEETDEKAN